MHALGFATGSDVACAVLFVAGLGGHRTSVNGRALDPTSIKGSVTEWNNRTYVLQQRWRRCNYAPNTTTSTTISLSPSPPHRYGANLHTPTLYIRYQTQLTQTHLARVWERQVLLCRRCDKRSHRSCCWQWHGGDCRRALETLVRTCSPPPNHVVGQKSPILLDIVYALPPFRQCAAASAQCGSSRLMVMPIRVQY